MLAGSLVEEFEIREDEPWYDQQDLQQGEAARHGARGAGGAAPGGCPRCGDPPVGRSPEGMGWARAEAAGEGLGEAAVAVAAPARLASPRRCSPRLPLFAGARRGGGCRRLHLGWGWHRHRRSWHRRRGVLRAARPAEPTRGGGTAGTRRV